MVCSISRTWYGTEQESADLRAALARDGACAFEVVGTRVGSCSAHGLLLADLATLDHVVYGRHLGAGLERQASR